jgi:integrase
MTIKKLGNKNYFIRVTKYINGKKKERKFTGMFPTVGAVKAKEKELLDKLCDIKTKTESETNRYTWKVALQDYFDYSEENLRLSTFYNRMKVLEAHTSSLNDLEIELLNKKAIKELLDGVKVSISHKKELLKYIRQVFELAIDNRKILINPAKNIKLQGDKNIYEKANVLTAMTKEEVTSFLNFSREINHEWYPIFYVTYQLGLRSSEAIALEFEDINWEKSHVVISKSWCKYKKGFVPPKNGNSRIVPMNKQLKTYLKELSLRAEGKGFVLPRIKQWLNGGATEVLQSIQKELGIKLTNYHSLRASFITHLLRSGMSVVSVQAMVGHRELSTTQRYIRLDATDLLDATVSLEIDLEQKGHIINFKKEIKN